MQQSTAYRYSRDLQPYFDFCEFYGKEPMAVSPRRMAEYICYLYAFTPAPYKSADKKLTALGHYWNCHGVNWDRKSYPSLAKLMRGYRFKKPSLPKTRKPFTFHLVRKAFQYINLQTYNGLLIGSALCIGYFFGGRVGEYAVNNREDWDHVIRECDLLWIGNPYNPSALIIDFRLHKSNKLGIYSAKVEAICSCDTGVCPVHIIFRFLKIRNSEFINVFDKPLLLNLSNMPMRQQHVNNFIKNIIIKMKLDPTDYSSHSLRSGRATDLARTLKPTWFIKKWGRWRSNCWEDHYAKLDFSDIAIIANIPLQALGLSDNTI